MEKTIQDRLKEKGLLLTKLKALNVKGIKLKPISECLTTWVRDGGSQTHEIVIPSLNKTAIVYLPNNKGGIASVSFQ